MSARLAVLAELRHLDGLQGWRGRRAWRRLVRAGDRGDGAARTAMWQMWLREPADEPWECLGRWIFELHDRVFTIVVERASDAQTCSDIGKFCVSHGVVPADPVDKALFFVLTGQTDQHRALDPDCALLAIAYRAAAPFVQLALRQAMVGAGNVDFVRVIAADRDREPTDEELDYFTRQLTRAGEWPDLWRLVRDLPLWQAVAAMPLFGGWRPRGEAEREVFDRFAAASSGVGGWQEAVPDLADELRAVRSLPMGRHWPVSCASFSPDGREVALASDKAWVRLFRLPDLRFIDQVSTRFAPGSVLHLGKSVITAETGPDPRTRPWLTRYADGRGTTLWVGVDRYDDILATAGLGDRFFVAKRRELLYGRSDGSPRRMAFPYPLSLATDPASGRIAVGGSREYDLSILDETLTTIARVRFPAVAGGRVHDVTFVGPDRLVTLDRRGRLRLWERTGHTLDVVTEALVPKYLWSAVTVSGGYRSPALHAFPLVGRIAVAGRGEVAWLDARTLVEIHPPPGLPAAGKTDIWSSADGTRLLLANGTQVQFADLLLRAVADVVTKPLSRLGPADLTVVTAATEQRDPRPAVRELLGLVRTRLEDRFATEISLGVGAVVRAEGDDIALGGRA
jgi:hypothetical protein